MKRTAELMGKDYHDLNMITCHLGNGASITAIKNGQVYNTSMGLSPLGGIMMGTRCGDIDPTVVYYVEEKYNCRAPDKASPVRSTDKKITNRKSSDISLCC